MSSPTRRQWLAALGVGSVAGAAGGWLWRSRQAPAPAEDPIPAALWSLSFERAGGGQLQLATLRPRALVINFWATWCPPCVKEMPELDRFATDFAAQGWSVVGVAIDRAEPVARFLTTTPVRFPIALAGFGGTELMRTLGNANGGLPFTIVLAPGGRLIERKQGPTHYDELAAWARQLAPK
jgi:thiol-disulfide isomerase/thioredoxin